MAFRTKNRMLFDAIKRHKGIRIQQSQCSSREQPSARTLLVAAGQLHLRKHACRPQLQIGTALSALVCETGHFTGEHAQH